MRILSIDPGHTTGMALLVDGEIKWAWTVAHDVLYGPNIFSCLVKASKPDVVLVEDIPNRYTDRLTLELWTHITRWFQVAGYETHIIKPSQWKGLSKRAVIPGQHARDAATMAMWYIQKEG